jgi:VanZ family protein
VNAPPTPQSDAESANIPLPLQHRVTIYRVMVAVVWTLIILTLCWLPSNVMQEVERDSFWSRIHSLDKVVHGGIFVLFSIFWLRVGSSPWRVLWVALGGLVLAVVTEFVQLLPIIGRDATIGDGLSDWIGALIGIALAPALEPLLHRLESRILRKSSS